MEQKACQLITLTRVEQNAIRKTAGFVIRKLENKCRHDCVMKECLWGLLQEEHDYNQDSSEEWLEATDRGGLYYITDTVFDLFVEIEVFVYSHLSQSQQQTWTNCKNLLVATRAVSIIRLFEHSFVFSLIE